VTSDSGATGALAAIDGLISQSIDAAAAFGSAQGRIETQSTFVSNLTDSLKSGIGSMVDADMEETSARLQALQVQQQLGVQSLSIANQAPQSILSLFR
jgi:flagellin